MYFVSSYWAASNVHSKIFPKKYKVTNKQVLIAELHILNILSILTYIFKLQKQCTFKYLLSFAIIFCQIITKLKIILYFLFYIIFYIFKYYLKVKLCSRYLEYLDTRYYNT